MADDILAVDTSHLLYRTFHEVRGNSTMLSPTQTRIAIERVVAELKQYKKKFKPTVFVAAFDDKYSWRSEYAQKNGLRTYRSARNKFDTLAERRMQQSFNTFREQVKDMLRKAGGIYVISGDRLEADDIIAGLAQVKREDDTLNVITLDHDTAHLMLIAGVVVYNMKTLTRFANVALKIKMLERILRGRHSYSVVSVFKRLTKDKFNQLVAGAITLNQLFKSEQPNDDTNIPARMRYKHNEVLLDVTKAPEEIKRKVREAIKRSLITQ